MLSYTDDGIVIKRHNFGEADKIITLYTKSLGKLPLWLGVSVNYFQTGRLSGSI